MALPFTFTALTRISATQVNANFTYLDNSILAVSGQLSGKLTATSNLSDLTNVPQARSNLGLGTAATAGTGTSGHVLGFLDGNNAWSGTNTFVTQAQNDNSTKAATTAYVDAKVTRSYLAGLALSTAGASATYGIAAGIAADSTNVSMLPLASAYTKTTAAWAVGSGNGSLDTGAIANTTWYHVFLIQRVDTGLVDVLCSLSATSPTLPASYTLFRRIGGMLTNGSAQWVLFTQRGDEFLWAVPVQDASATAIGTSAVTQVLTVPTGVQVNAVMNFAGLNTTPTPAKILVSSLDTTDTAPTNTLSSVACGQTANQYSVSLNVRTSTAAGIRVRSDTATVTSYFIGTFGWIDRRGRDN